MNYLNQIMAFVLKSMEDGMSSTPSTRRVVFFGFATLGAAALLSGLGFAAALLIGFDQAQRLEYFKEVLSFVKWMFATGITASGLTYGITKMAEKRGIDNVDDAKE